MQKRHEPDKGRFHVILMMPADTLHLQVCTPGRVNSRAAHALIITAASFSSHRDRQSSRIGRLRRHWRRSRAGIVRAETGKRESLLRLSSISQCRSGQYLIPCCSFITHDLRLLLANSYEHLRLSKHLHTTTTNNQRPTSPKIHARHSLCSTARAGAVPQAIPTAFELRPLPIRCVRTGSSAVDAPFAVEHY